MNMKTLATTKSTEQHGTRNISDNVLFCVSLHGIHSYLARFIQEVQQIDDTRNKTYTKHMTLVEFDAGFLKAISTICWKATRMLHKDPSRMEMVCQ